MPCDSLGFGCLLSLARRTPIDFAKPFRSNLALGFSEAKVRPPLAIDRIKRFGVRKLFSMNCIDEVHYLAQPLLAIIRDDARPNCICRAGIPAIGLYLSRKLPSIRGKNFAGDASHIHSRQHGSPHFFICPNNFTAASVRKSLSAVSPPAAKAATA